MSDCRFCGATGLSWHENLGCLVNEITGKKHGPQFCQARPINRYDYVGGIAFDRREDIKALEQTQEAMRLGLDPFTAKAVRDGDKLILKR